MQNMSGKVKKFVRLTNGLYEGGKMVPIEEWGNHIPNWNSDWYRSVGTYTPEQVEIFKSQKHLLKPGVKGDGAVRGLTGVKTNCLVLDFDSEGDLEKARSNVVGCIEDLGLKGIMPENYNICFSGSKGFAIEIFLDKEYTSKELKVVAENLAGHYDCWDTSLYDENQLIRVPGTRHPKTGLYKTSLTMEEICSLPIEKIKEKAVTGTVDWNETPNVLPPELFKPKFKEKPKKEVEGDLDFSSNTLGMPNWKFAILHGYFPPGKRHDCMLALASYFKGAGFPIEVTKNMVFEASRLQYERNTDHYRDDPTDEGELTRTIEHIYGPTWTGGTFAYETNEKLKKSILDLFPEEALLDEQEDLNKPIKTISEMLSSSKHFMKNIETNRIYTGMPEVDKNIILTTGAMHGLLASPGAGKCHGKNTPILMFDGSIKMVQDIKVGDQLMGDDSTPRNVLSLANGIEELFNIIPIKGDKYIVNKSHILSLRCCSNGKYKGIKKDDIIDIPLTQYLDTCESFKGRFKGFRVGVEWENKELPFSPYYVGLWLGDGCMDSPRITNKDEDLEPFFKEFALDNSLFYTKQFHKDRCANHNFASKEGKGSGVNPLKNFIRENLLKNGEKYIPNDYLINSRQNRLELLAGLLDSDGHLCKNYFEITQKNKQLADQILFLARSLGFAAYLSTCEKECVNNGVWGTYHRITISGHVQEIPTLIKRKQGQKRKQIKNVLNTGIRVESIGEGEYFGFTLDGNHRYLLGDFTVTHNTALAINMLAHNSKLGLQCMFFSLDMSENLIGAKLIARQSPIGFRELTEKYKNNVDMSEVELLVEDDFKNVAFYSKSSTSVKDMKMQILKHQKSIGQKVKFVVVDYLELLSGPYSDQTANSAHHAVQLKDLSTDLDICLIILIQPQKSAGDASFPLTSMRQVKGASLLEQNFRNILGIYREGFSPDTPELDKFLTIKGLKSSFEGLFSVDVRWDGKTGRVYTLSSEERSQLKRIRDAKLEKKEEGNDW